MPTNDHEMHQTPGPHDVHVRDAESPGYETTDVNAGGVAVFLAGLFGSVLVFFIFCFVMGKVINSAIEKSDGPTTKWNKLSAFAGAETTNGKRQDLASNPEMQQREFQQMTSSFPEPRLDIDDGNQATADMHAREDLLLNYYSVTPAENGSIRIPISRAMELIAQRGLPVSPQAAATVEMAGDEKPVVLAPLTSGFARTGYELEVIEAREQKMTYGKAEAATQAEFAPAK
ncbi:hypothetical protein [Tunturiibacter gelidoferens]|uniref:Uncharacterized protein n=2 Tax=Tunturiibacter gelidiferens TaxID=3069689 RepID=A0AAU7Z3C3_9BACT|nr:hypothetical protein [Edaphobacter lichenicola]MBB5340596.1 hypothetical protein [Edaphobacter lichenicola]